MDEHLDGYPYEDLYWRVVDATVREVFGRADTEIDALCKDIMAAPERERLMFYHNDPLDVAADLAGVRPDEAQAARYREMEARLLADREKPADHRSRARRGPTQKDVESAIETSVIDTSAISRNIIVGGRRTSMRLAPFFWDALDDIARREALTIHELCTLIKERLDQQAHFRGDAVEDKVTLTSAVRVLITLYYRRAATEQRPEAKSQHKVSIPTAESFADAPKGTRRAQFFSEHAKPESLSQRLQASMALMDAMLHAA